MFCGYCGTPLSGGARFCGGCGTPLQGSPDPPTVAWNETSRRHPSMGEVLVDRFRLERDLGEGAFLAFDLVLGEPVRVELLPDTVDSQEARFRLREEARRAATLAHEGILQLHELCEGAESLVVVSEPFEAESLHARMERDGALPLADVVAIGIWVCKAMAHAHGRDVIHGDFGTRHVWLSPDGGVKVSGFGFAGAIRDILELPSSDLDSAMTVLEPVPRTRGKAEDLVALGEVLKEAAGGSPIGDGPWPQDAWSQSQSDGKYGFLFELVQDLLDPSPDKQAVTAPAALIRLVRGEAALAKAPAQGPSPPEEVPTAPAPGHEGESREAERPEPGISPSDESEESTEESGREEEGWVLESSTTGEGEEEEG